MFGKQKRIFHEDDNYKNVLKGIILIPEAIQANKIPGLVDVGSFAISDALSLHEYNNNKLYGEAALEPCLEKISEADFYDVVPALDDDRNMVENFYRSTFLRTVNQFDVTSACIHAGLPLDTIIRYNAFHSNGATYFLEGYIDE